ncbi:UNVERIFIED_CONTAM: hypothetical protein NCL1_41896 [Trichonephila clavipes]
MLCLMLCYIAICDLSLAIVQQCIKQRLWFENYCISSFRSYCPYGLNATWNGGNILPSFKQKSEDSLYIPNFDKSIGNNNNIGIERISGVKRRKRVTRDMTTLKKSMLELANKFDDKYNTGLIKSFMFGM